MTGKAAGTAKGSRPHRPLIWAARNFTGGSRRDHPPRRQSPRRRLLQQRQGNHAMTLRQPNIDRMLQLGLTGLAEALEEQRNIADAKQLGLGDRLARMIERKGEHRD